MRNIFGRSRAWPLAEALEARRLLATTVISDLGDLTSPAISHVLSGQSNTANVERFKFKLGKSAELFAGLTHLSKADLFADSDPSGQLTIVSLDSSGNTLASLGKATFVHFSSPLTLRLPAGSYAADVTDSNNLGGFDLVMHGDLADGRFIDNDNFDATVGRDFGALSTSGFDGKDFAGNFQEFQLQGDLIDTYLFDIVKQGTVGVTIDAIDGPFDGTIGETFRVGLFRDSNNDGVFNSLGAENLASTRLHEGSTFTTSKSLSPGKYGIVVNTDNFDSLDGIDYRLRISYSVPDGAGDSLFTPKNVGVVGAASVNFTDFLSATDIADVYKFTTLAGGPFVFNGTLSGQLAGSNFNMILVKDVNGNNIIDSGEVLASGNQPGNANETISRSFTTPGDYFVMIQEIAGEGPYNLSFNCTSSDAGRNTLATAQSVGNLLGKETISETVGAFDTVDFFKFSTTDFGFLTASTAALSSGNIDLTLFKADGTQLAFSNQAGTAAESIATSLAAGTYALRVRMVSGTANYDLAWSVDTASSNLFNAKPIGFGTAGGLFEYVGPEDPHDVFRFTIGQPQTAGVFPVIFSGDGVHLQMGADSNNNGTLDINEKLINSDIVGAPLNLVGNLFAAGNFFVLVDSIGVGSTYSLVIGTAPLDTAGNTPGRAQGVGTLPVGTTVVTGALNDNVLNPLDDFDDFFRVNVTTPGELAFALSGAASGLAVDVGQDTDNDNAIGLGELLATTVRADSPAILPAAGTYFVHVRSSSHVPSNYTLSLTFSKQTPFGGSPIRINNINPTIVEAENFDAGPDPDAYHDSDNFNEEGFFRTDVGADVKNEALGGFRLTDTAVGEFVEYTIDVSKSLTYNLEFQLSSPGDGGAFHAEIDGVNVTGQLTVPNTGGFDNMQALTKTGVAISAGRHILRLAFDAGATNGPKLGFAGSYNFIRVIPPASPGTFELSPSHTSVRPGTSTKLALEWTVPSGGWRVLKDVELRLRDDDGRTILRIRFNEAANTFQLYDPKKKKFGKAKTVGSNSTLSNKFGRVNLSTSTVQADGPTDPSVVITFDITLKKNLKGRHLTAEAAASDDLGHAAAFAFAGTLDVTR